LFSQSTLTLIVMITDTNQTHYNILHTSLTIIIHDCC